MKEIIPSTDLEILDISPVISSETAVFPGDTNFKMEFLMETNLGQNITLSKITTTPHIGAHADGPIHYAPQSLGIGERSLHFYLGHCQVVEIATTDLESDLRIRRENLKAKIVSRRVLFKTKSFPDSQLWQDRFCSLHSDLVRELAEEGVILVGIDTPSIDPSQEKHLSAHEAVHKADLAILEGLVLDKIQPGVYFLIALPLKIKDGDASPVRAVLIRQEEWHGKTS